MRAPAAHSWKRGAGLPAEAPAHLRQGYGGQPSPDVGAKVGSLESKKEAGAAARCHRPFHVLQTRTANREPRIANSLLLHKLRTNSATWVQTCVHVEIVPIGVSDNQVRE